MLLHKFAATDSSLRVYAIDQVASYTSRTLGLGQVKGGHNRVRLDGTVDREFLGQCEITALVASTHFADVGAGRCEWKSEVGFIVWPCAPRPS